MDFDNSTSNRPLSVKITQTVADAENTTPTKLPSLNSVIDVDALDTIFHEQNHGSVMFDYQGYTVTAQNGTVILENPPPNPERNGVEYGTVDVSVTSFDSSPESVFFAVVSAVSDLSETEPTELPPLYSVVDPDALSSLVTRTESGSSHRTVFVSFIFDGYPITVTNDGIVAVQRSKAVRNPLLGKQGGL